MILPETMRNFATLVDEALPSSISLEEAVKQFARDSESFISLCQSTLDCSFETFLFTAEDKLSTDFKGLALPEAIMGERLQKGQKQFLIKWRGFSDTAATWENAELYQELEEFGFLVLAWKGSQKARSRGGSRQKQRYCTFLD
jgi:hypothetical protein